MASTDTIAQNIFNQALKGSDNNRGLTTTLANLVVAQTKHETAVHEIPYQSNAFLIDNNAVGYKLYAGSDYQTAAGITSSEGDPYGHYDTYQDSIKELVDWLYRRQREGSFPDLATITTADQYAGLLKSVGYYGDSQGNYTAGLRRWFKQYGPVAAAGIGVGVVALVAGLFFLLKRKKIKS